MRMLPRILLVGLVLASGNVAAQQARDVSRPPIAGTAALSGVVMNDASPASPVRRALVTLTESVRGDTHTTVTDDEGRFTFEELPAGRFALSASKGGFVKSAYGAVRPGGLGVALSVADGGRTANVRVTLHRAGVITGALRDRRGAPIQDALVYATRPGTTADSRRGVSPDSGGSSRTDDRGTYRIFGLRPGEYQVWAPAPLWVEAGITRLTTDEDVQRARQLMRSSPTASSGQPALLVSEAGVSYANSYHSNTALPSQATLVRVGPGEERTGVDLVQLLLPTFRLAGSVVGANGQAAKNPRVWIRPDDEGGTREQFELRSAPDGTFTVARVLPGRYLIGAESATGTTPEWARLVVTVSGESQTDLVVRLQGGLRVSGRIEFEPGSLPVPSLQGYTVSLFEADQNTLHTIPAGAVAADGSFAIETVAAARYRLIVAPRTTGRTTLPAGWSLKSITGAGPDVADVPLEVRADRETPALTITLTSQTTELSGQLQDAGGRPATAFTIVAFTTNRAFWAPQSRRIEVARPADDGQFSIKGLPAGDYMLAAVTDIDDVQQFDPRFLATLIGAAVPVKVVEGQRTVQNLRIAK